MLHDGVQFKEAARSLGAWDSVAGSVQPRAQQFLERRLVLEYLIDGVQYRTSVRDEDDSYVRVLRRFRGDASDRLTEIRRGDSEGYVGEEEDCWVRTAL